MLRVGIDHPIAEVIDDQLPGTPMIDGYGHDGKYFYAIGLDLTARWIPEQMDAKSASYRYRRIAYPTLSSFFGTLEGSHLLWGMNRPGFLGGFCVWKRGCVHEFS